MSNYVAGLVSVVIPTYKRSDSLVRAINSVKNQTYPFLEIIIVNDNQVGDNYSLELYDKMKLFEFDNNVFLVEQEKHINGAAARNAGIKRAKGEYLAFLDDDDYWDIHKIDHQMMVLQHLDKSWGAVGCMSIHIKCEKPFYVSTPHKDGYIFNEIMQRTIGLGTGSLLMRRDAVDDTGLFDETLSRHQDIQFFGFFCFKYKIKLVKEYLYYIDYTDTSNRPDAFAIKKVKQDFYHAVEPLISSMNKSDKNKFFIMNNFEVGVVEWKNGCKIEGIKKILCVLRYPSTFYQSLRRVVVRVLGKIFKNLYMKKYLPLKDSVR